MHKYLGFKVSLEYVNFFFNYTNTKCTNNKKKQQTRNNNNKPDFFFYLLKLEYFINDLAFKMF